MIRILKLSGVLCLLLFSAATQPQAGELVRFGSLYYPPFVDSVVTPGKEGIAIDKVRKVFAAMGRDVEINVLPWKRSQAKAESGEYYGIYPCGLVKKWEAKYALSNPVFIDHLVLVAKKGKFSGIRSLEDLNDPKLSSPIVGIAQGYAVIKELEKVKIRSIYIVPSDTNGLGMIKKDRLDFIYTGEIGFTALAAKGPGFAVTNFDVFRMREFRMGACFSLAAAGWEQRLKEFNDTLKALKTQ